MTLDKSLYGKTDRAHALSSGLSLPRLPSTSTNNPIDKVASLIDIIDNVLEILGDPTEFHGPNHTQEQMTRNARHQYDPRNQ